MNDSDDLFRSQLETGVFEFRNPTLERVTGLTSADRKWMDDIVKDVNESFDATDPTGSPNIQFKGSDDYLRQKVNERPNFNAESRSSTPVR